MPEKAVPLGKAFRLMMVLVGLTTTLSAVFLMLWLRSYTCGGALMTQWTWLSKPTTPYTWRFVARVALKALALFVAFNVLFALLDPLPILGRISMYNGLIPGRARLPYGENPVQSYNLSLNNLDAMFASHEVSRPKAADEYRVLLMGDSATWGWLLKPEDTLAGQLNAAHLTTADGRKVRVYNLGHPDMSLTKDLLLLDYAMRYRPDRVVWVITLRSFPREEQFAPPLVRNNPRPVRDLIATYQLDLDPHDSRLVDPSFLDMTIVGRRRELADWLRLQLYGIPYAITGIDQHYPESYPPRQSDFDEDLLKWQSFAAPQTLTEKELAFDVLKAGIARAGEAPVLLVNEPMFISSGRNSDVRYNFFYPRWAYDQYRDLLAKTAADNGWDYLDLWDAIPPDEFTDSPVHLTPKGAQQMSKSLAAAMLEMS